jgi:hypothetical protein
MKLLNPELYALARRSISGRLITGGLLAVFSQTVYAHEMRHVGGANGTGEGANVFMFHVGFLDEPAFSNELNGIDINLSFHPDEAHDKALTENVNTTNGDTVIIETAEVLYMGKETGRNRKLARRKLIVETDDKGNIKKKYGTDNKYPVYFRPTKAGKYGFRLKGSMAHNGVSVDFDETFVCDTGSQDVDVSTGVVKSKFSCVKDAIDFPKDEKRSESVSASDNHGQSHKGHKH